MSKQRYGCQYLGSLTCEQMLMHAIAHEGCTDTVRESALKADSGKKILCRAGESNQLQRRVIRTLYQLSYPPPQHEPLLATVKRRMSQATTASQKPSFRAPRRVATLWSAEELMLDGQCPKMDVPAHARTADNGCRKDWKRVSAESSLLSHRQPDWSKD